MRVDNLPIPKEAVEIIEEQDILKLYPPQEEAIKAGALDGKNLVLASPTASGKTLIAELCAIKHVMEQNGKVLYLTPLRALASEKYNEFRKYTRLRKGGGARVKVAISTGDYDSSNPWLERADIIITTNEKADSLLRHKAHWMSDVTLVVADEVHLLNDVGRGPTLEVILTRLLEINPKAQILALSATIRNADEVAEWLKARSITTEWRPIKLVEGVCLHKTAEFNDGSSIKISGDYRDPVINLVEYTVKKNGQALVFTETRKRAVSYAKKTAIAVNKLLSRPEKRSLKFVSDRILAAGERTRVSDLLAKLVQQGVAFHHAGLSSSHRKIVEDAFRAGKIKATTATPTLAYGVNLPARMVIISSYKRYLPGYGRYPISVLDFKQMSGRAGRPRYDKVGEALLIAVTSDEQDYLMKSYVFSKPEKLWSKLAVERVLRSHVLASIASGFTHSEQGLYDFFEKTFYAYQYESRNIKPMVAKILRFLYKEGMVTLDGKSLSATDFGRRVSELYIDPVSGVIIRDGLYNRADSLTDLSFLHLVCHTPDVTPKYYPRRREMDGLNVYISAHRKEFMFEVPDEWADRIPYEEFLGEVKCALVLESWINEVSEDNMIERFSVEPGDLFRLTETVKWLLYASHELCRLFGHKDLLAKTSALRRRVESGAKAELLPLIRLKGIGRIRGRALFNAGFKTIKGLKHASISQLTDIPLIGPQVAKKIKEQVGGLVKSDEWKRLKEEKGEGQKQLSEY